MGEVQLHLSDALGWRDLAEDDSQNGPDRPPANMLRNLQGHEEPCGCRGSRQEARSDSASDTYSIDRFGPVGEFLKNTRRQMLPTENDKYGVSSIAEAMTWVGRDNSVRPFR